MPPKAFRRLWAVSAAIVLLLTIEPTAAGASTAQVSDFFGVAYQAAPGEKNDLSATVTAASSVYDTMRFADPGASITPGKGCKAAGAHAVTCTFQVPAAAGNVDLGDGDDAARLPTLAQTGMLFWNVNGGAGADRLSALPGAREGPPLLAAGGPGNDVLAGSAGDDRLDGGPGNDVLGGAAGSDTLDGGGGRDRLQGGGQDLDYLADGDHEGAVDADVLDGGGRGVLDYSSRTRPVRVDLTDPSADGESGEGDVVRGFGEVHTGSGEDTLIGTSRAEMLDGGPGADRMEGRGGRDHLYATAGDFADAGGGNDHVLVGPLAPARVVCGSGRDGVDGDPELGVSGGGPLISRTCEELSTQSEDLPATLFRPPRPVAASHRGRLVFRLRCPGLERRCRPRFDITRGRRPFRLLARRRVRIRHSRRRVALRLPRSVVRQARKHEVRLRFHFVGRSREFGDVEINWRVDLRLR